MPNSAIQENLIIQLTTAYVIENGTSLLHRLIFLQGDKMAEVKWIKIATDIFDNQKIKIIESMPDGDAIIVIWFKILMLAGNVNDGGSVYFTQDIPYTEQMLATVFNRPLTTIQLAMKTFEEFGMIEIVDDIIQVSNWEKYQNVDGLERIREQTRLRVAKHREKKKLECNATGNATVTQSNAIDIDIDKELEEDIKSKAKSTRFVPPTLEQVQDYCKERNNNVDAERFIDFYESKGWMVGKNKMKDWKACVRTWEKRDAKPAPKQEEDNLLAMIEANARRN